MQTTPSVQPAPEAPAPPALPASPPPPPAPVVVDARAVAGQAEIVAVEAAAVAARTAPRTAQDIAALRKQRSWLSDQLVSAQERRKDVARALEGARDPANRSGLEQRLQTLDQRILQLETDIAETGRLLTTAPASAIIADPPRSDRSGGGSSGPDNPLVFIALLFLAVLQVATLVRGRRQRHAPAAYDPTIGEAAARLARLEHAVDSIAVEVERVSEGQRFVTRLLADSRANTEQAPAMHEYRPN